MVRRAAATLKRVTVRWMRRDGIALLLFVLVTTVMTYPLVLHLGGNWVSTTDQGRDVFMKLWDIWWFDRILQAGEPLFFTDLLFYPHGLDLTFHSLNWTATTLAWLLIPISGSILSAYKITILIGLVAVSYSAYLLALELTRHRMAAWFGGIIYGFSPFLLTHSKSHPDLVQIAPIPIAVLLLTKALRDKSVPAAIGAALAVGVAAWSSMYILTFISLTLGLLYLYLLVDDQRWRQLRFWKITAVFAVIALLLVGSRLIPWLPKLEDLSGTLKYADRPDQFQTDLLAYLIPSTRHPVFGPMVDDRTADFGRSRDQPPYLGIIPILLTLSALSWKKVRKKVWPWPIIGAFFLLLSLGSVLRFNSQLYKNVPLLLPLLDWFPPIRGVRTNFYHIGLLLPLAICSAYGIQRWTRALEHRRHQQVALLVALSLLTLVEYSNGPFPLKDVSISPFYLQLSEDDNNSTIVELPMGRSHSKLWLYFQTIHGHPMVEGASARTPDSVYGYIRDNLLLSLLMERTELDCNTISVQGIKTAIDQLVRDDIRYFVIHSSPPEQPFSSYFAIDPIFRQDGITAFDLLDLQDSPPCSK